MAAKDEHPNPILPVFLTVFIDLVGFSILIPVFPLLISPGSPFKVTPDTWTYQQGLIMLGFLQAVYPLCTFVAAPILGQLSDRFGRRPVLAFSIAGTAIGYVIFAFGHQRHLDPAAVPRPGAGRPHRRQHRGRASRRRRHQRRQQPAEELRAARRGVRARLRHRPVPRRQAEPAERELLRAVRRRRRGSRPPRRSSSPPVCACSTWC